MTLGMKQSERLKPDELLERMQKKDGSLFIVDVRSEDEFNSGSLEGALCIPHDVIGSMAHTIPKDKDLVLLCQSGKRSAKARGHLLQPDFNSVYELEGGMKAWQEAKHPVVKKRSAIPIQRQVLIVAGTIVLLGNILGLVVNEAFYAVAIFVSLGLIFAGVSGFCGMAIVLEKMPWNKINECKL
jgi:rhodanese-related sulfurtransferase